MKNKIDKTSKLINCKLGKNIIILPYCIIEDSIIEDNCIIGPFARIRPHCIIKNNSKIGNFCEIKNSIIGKNCAVSHLSYIGDAEIGDNCNIGAGTIFCNYNGKIKQKSYIGNNCFIGSNSLIIAPVSIGNNCFLAGASIVRENLQNDSFVKTETHNIIKKNNFVFKK